MDGTTGIVLSMKNQTITITLEEYKQRKDNL